MRRPEATDRGQASRLKVRPRPPCSGDAEAKMGVSSSRKLQMKTSMPYSSTGSTTCMRPHVWLNFFSMFYHARCEPRMPNSTACSEQTFHCKVSIGLDSKQGCHAHKEHRA